MSVALDPIVTFDDIGYSVNRLAALSGWSEPTLRRWLGTDELHAELMQMRSLTTAVVAARAIRHGHDLTAIRAVNAVPYLSSGLWLVSITGHAQVLGSLTKVATWLEDRPADKAVLSNIGQLSMDTATPTR